MAGNNLIDRYLADVERALGPRAAAELLEELEGHLEDAAARHRAAGMDHQQALAMALRDVGTVTDLMAAMAANSEREARIVAATRWTGLAGIAVVPAAVLGVMFWHPATFVLTWALAAAAVVGLLARHWSCGRREIVAAVALFAVGMVVSQVNAVGTAHAIYTVGIPAAFTLAAVTLVCVAMLRGDAVPAPAVLLILGGVAVMLGINTALYVIGNEPPYLATVGAIAAIAGWVWTNAVLAIRSSQPAAPATA